MTKGLELAEAYYKAYGQEMLRTKFPQVIGQTAVGLAGYGSECLGFDDEVFRYAGQRTAVVGIRILTASLKQGKRPFQQFLSLPGLSRLKIPGDYATALRYYRQALQIYSGVLPPEDYRYAGLYNNMSILLEKTEENEEAIACARKALAIIEKLEGGEMETATTLTNLVPYSMLPPIPILLSFDRFLHFLRFLQIKRLFLLTAGDSRAGYGPGDGCAVACLAGGESGGGHERQGV